MFGTSWRSAAAIAWRGSIACPELHRPVRDAEAVRDVVTGIAREVLSRLLEDARERRIVLDELFHSFASM